MKRKVIRINEQQLHHMISESVKKVLNKMYESSMGPDANGPSQEEEEFEDELYRLIDEYKGLFISRGYKRDEFYKWCCEIIDNALPKI